LMIAASNGYLNIVRFLVEETNCGDRDSLEATNHERNTAVMLAARHGWLHIVRYLASQGVEVESENLYGHTIATMPFTLRVREHPVGISRGQLIDAVKLGLQDKDECDLEDGKDFEVDMKSGAQLRKKKGVEEEQKASILRLRKGQRYVQDTLYELHVRQFESAFEYCKMADAILYPFTKLREEGLLKDKVVILKQMASEANEMLESRRRETIRQLGIQEAVKYDALAKQYILRKEFNDAIYCYEIAIAFNPDNKAYDDRLRETTEKSKHVGDPRRKAEKDDKRGAYCDGPHCFPPSRHDADIV